MYSAPPRSKAYRRFGRAGLSGKDKPRRHPEPVEGGRAAGKLPHPGAAQPSLHRHSGARI